MSREVCGICWCPYDEFTGECACVPEPKEPVAWMFVDDTGMKFVSVDRPHKQCQPLYTAPPQRKPLSEEEALEIARTFGAQPWPPGSCVAFARAVERAHNII